MVSRRAFNSAATARRWRGQAGEPTSSRAASWSGRGTKKLSTTWMARSRSRTGPRAASAPTRRLGEVALVSEQTWTTTPSGSSAASGRGSGPASSWTRRRAKSSSTTKAPASRAIRSTSPRRSGASTAPVGFWKSGWQTKTRAPVARKASASSSGRTPSRVDRDRHGPQPGGAGDRQHARIGGRLDEHGGAGRGERAQGGGQRGLAARRDQHLGGGDRRRRCPRANHSRSSGSPSMGGRPQAPGRRPARARAAAMARSGWSEGCR